MSAPNTQAKGPTEEISSWVSSLTLANVPNEIKTRAKHIILDGLACGLVGAHLPWSEKAAEAIFDLEPAGGDTTLIGWGDKKASALSCALLNSTFIQGFELDDWNSEAPLHSNSILLPALLAAAQRLASEKETSFVSGSDLLIATIAGYEVGPRVGLALYGAHVLTTGWHSGAVFGPAASAAAVGKLLGLTAEQIEDAFGTACTQACGLMSAQFESEAKRMQHGFAARNGLLAAFLARRGYVGIKSVFEREYGGFLKQFSLGNGKEPPYIVEELYKDLGVKWQIEDVCIKAYASMAGTHPTIDCVRKMQELYPEQMKTKIHDIEKIRIELGEAAFHHGGWKAERPLTSTGAQMNNAFVAATQIVHRQVLPAQFRNDMLKNEQVWKLVDVTECALTNDVNRHRGEQSMEITFGDGEVLQVHVENARGIDPALSNADIVDKWRLLMKDVIDPERADRIEKMVLGLEELDDVSALQELLEEWTKNPIA